MKKTVFLGDSILLQGYGVLVPELLKNDCTVRIPEQNGRFTINTLRMIHDYRSQIEGADVIHYNNGLWDACHLFGDGIFTSVDDYVRNVCRIVRILQGWSKQVIFATTTPVREHPEIVNEDIVRYNEAVVPALLKMGVVIDDLYSVVTPNIDDYIRRDDHIHLTEPAMEVCAAQVADVVRTVLAKL